MLTMRNANKKYNMLKLKDNTLIKSASYASVVIDAVILIINIYGWEATEYLSFLASLIVSCLNIST